MFYSISTVLVAESQLPEDRLVKWQEQFAHCSARKLETLLRPSGHMSCSTRNRIESDFNRCSNCVHFGRLLPRPFVPVYVPLLCKTNYIIAMDVHQMPNLVHLVLYLHMIDVFTRFSVAGLTYDKKPKVNCSCLSLSRVFSSCLSISIINGQWRWIREPSLEGLCWKLWHNFWNPSSRKTVFKWNRRASQHGHKWFFSTLTERPYHQFSGSDFSSKFLFC